MASPRTVPKGDLVLAVAMIALGILTLFGSLDLPEPVLEPIGPAAFPVWTAIILICLSVYVLGHALKIGGPEESAPEYRKRPELAAKMVALTVLYFTVMDLGWLGFRWATVAYVLILTMTLFDYSWRKLPMATALALFLGIGVHFTFTRFLYIDFP